MNHSILWQDRHDGRKNAFVGYLAGITAGVAYGTNPLFGKELLAGGASVSAVLFFRYLFATIFMGLLMVKKKESFRVSRKQIPYLVILGLCFSTSSLLLFSAYNYIPAGLATTVVYLYPIFTAVIMAVLRVRQPWQIWGSVLLTNVGVFILMNPLGSAEFNLLGTLLAAASALSYAIYLIVINRSRQMQSVSAHTITFYALGVGVVLFLGIHLCEGEEFLRGIDSGRDWADLVCLGLVPTMISMLALAVSTKSIGPTKTAVLGVFEPITAIAIGAIAFGEPFTANVAAGALICIAGIVFMIVSGNKNHTI